MPYRTNAQLPDAVRNHLPAAAQTIYRSAFNKAWDRYRKSDSRYEEISHRIAWTAVKRAFRKDGDRWVAKRDED